MLNTKIGYYEVVENTSEKGLGLKKDVKWCKNYQ